MKVLSILLVFTIAVACFADTIVYRGTICGWGDPSNLNQVLCKGLNPIDSCPPGFLRQQLEGNVAYCYKNSTTIEKDGAPLGTLCGGLARSFYIYSMTSVTTVNSNNESYTIYQYFPYYRMNFSISS
ncbi:unnamed protein product [Adineta steineri]|uniref:Uncharacterized protein n=1 Tax=Adineta steineri TaxID=433720 RepID=A0A815QT21_9BILA|nr:unnamed protein product [Adineta steineri]